MDTKQIMVERLISFSQKEADEIKILVAMLGESKTPLLDDDLKEILNTHPIHLLVARDLHTQQIVGMVTLAVYRIPYTKKAYLDDLVVDTAYRGQGIGVQLLQAATTQAKNLGASYIELTSNPKRIAGNKLYQKLGFTLRVTNVYHLDITKEV